MKFAFVGIDFFFACLELLRNEGAQVIKVFSFTPSPNDSNRSIQQLARRVGVPFTTDRIRRPDIDHLIAKGCDHLFIGGYPYKVPTDERIRMINIHPTLLPEGRGPSPLHHVILKQLATSGVTFHRATDTFDQGDIVCQEAFRVDDRETFESLACKCQMAATRLMRRFLSDPDRYWEASRPQGQGSYWPAPSASDSELDWTLSNDQIKRTVRAFGRLGSRARFAGRRWLVREITTWVEDHQHPPGSLVHRSHRELVVASREGFICLRAYQPLPGR